MSESNIEKIKTMHQLHRQNQKFPQPNPNDILTTTTPRHLSTLQARASSSMSTMPANELQSPNSTRHSAHVQLSQATNNQNPNLSPQSNPRQHQNSTIQLFSSSQAQLQSLQVTSTAQPKVQNQSSPVASSSLCLSQSQSPSSSSCRVPNSQHQARRNCTKQFTSNNSPSDASSLISNPHPPQEQAAPLNNNKQRHSTAAPTPRDPRLVHHRHPQQQLQQQRQQTCSTRLLPPPYVQTPGAALLISQPQLAPLGARRQAHQTHQIQQPRRRMLRNSSNNDELLRSWNSSLASQAASNLGTPASCQLTPLSTSQNCTSQSSPSALNGDSLLISSNEANNKRNSWLKCAEISVKWYIVVIALLGLILALVGTIVGAIHSARRDYVSLALLLLGVGFVLVAIIWIALKISVKTYKAYSAQRQAQQVAMLSRQHQNFYSLISRNHPQATSDLSQLLLVAAHLEQQQHPRIISSTQTATGNCYSNSSSQHNTGTRLSWMQRAWLRAKNFVGLTKNNNNPSSQAPSSSLQTLNEAFRVQMPPLAPLMSFLNTNLLATLPPHLLHQLLANYANIQQHQPIPLHLLTPDMLLRPPPPPYNTAVRQTNSALGLASNDTCAPQLLPNGIGQLSSSASRSSHQVNLQRQVVVQQPPRHHQQQTPTTEGATTHNKTVDCLPSSSSSCQISARQQRHLSVASTSNATPTNELILATPRHAHQDQLPKRNSVRQNDGEAGPSNVDTSQQSNDNSLQQTNIKILGYL